MKSKTRCDLELILSKRTVFEGKHNRRGKLYNQAITDSTDAILKREATVEEVMKGICCYTTFKCKECIRESLCGGNAIDLKKKFIILNRKEK